MIRKITIVVILCLVFSAIGFKILGENTLERTYSDNINIQKSEPIELNFAGLNVKLVSWNNDTAKIIVRDVLEKQYQGNLQIHIENNDFTIQGVASKKVINYCLDTWLPVAQIKKYRGDYLFTTRSHLEVYLPAGSQVKVNAKKLTVVGDIKIIN